MGLQLTFRAPTEPLSVNDRVHWAERSRRLNPWKMTSWALARNALGMSHRAEEAQVPVVVQVVIPFRHVRRRDPHNYTGTVAKACVDGLVHAGVIPDDTAEWLTMLDPELVAPSQSLTATVRVWPRTEQANERTEQ